MELGGVVAGRVVEEVLSSTLLRARGPGGTVLLRLGPREREEWAQQLVRSGLALEVVVTEQRTILVCEDIGGSAVEAGLDNHALRFLFLELARRIRDLHGSGVRVGGLDPEGVRGPGLLVPMVYLDPAWVAPEGVGADAADWYAFGLLLYWALTGRAAFEESSDRFERNGPDPRDLRAGAPADLSSLCMDLLAIEPGERPGAEEILAVLEPSIEHPVVSLDWVEALGSTGGLWVRDSIEGAREILGEGWVELDGVDGLVGDDGVLRRVMEARALSRSERGLAGTAIQRGDVLRGASRRRAGTLLGQALATTGVKICVVRGDPLGPVACDTLEGLLRARPTPAVVVLGSAPRGFVERVVAAGERVHGEEDSPESLVDQMELIRSAGEGLDAACAAVRFDGSTASLVDALGLLGVPVRGGVWGRSVAAVGALGVGPMREVARDATRVRAARKGAAHLALVDPERAAVLGAWVWRRAHRVGDSRSAAFVAASRVLVTGEVPAMEGGPLDEIGQAGLALARGVHGRRSGDPGAVVRALRGKLPLAGGGAAETAIAALMLVEAHLDRGEWDEAVRLVRRCRVDARTTGNALLELGALCLGARLCLPVGAAMERLAGRLQLGGVLGWWVARARAHALLLPMGPSAALPVLEAGVQLLPTYPDLGALTVEARHWVCRMRGAAGGEIDTPGPHPMTPGWLALIAAHRARRAGDHPELLAQLTEAASRFEGSGAELLAAACRRQWGLVQGGNRGGNAVTAADQVFEKVGAHGAVATLHLLPELASPL